MDIRLPIKRKQGGPRKGDKEEYARQLQVFAEDIKEVQRGLDFHMSARGWCYNLEPYGLEKGNFRDGEKWIRQCRVRGLLEPGFILEDESHKVEQQLDEGQSVEDYIYMQYEMWQEAEEYFSGSWEFYKGISFWENKDYYLQLLVEKVDLKSLFRSICNKYRIPMANLRGWGSLEQKAVIAKNFELAEEEDKEPILLVCTDFDPPGLCISKVLKGDFEELSTFTGWEPVNLKIERIGLDYKFIQQNNLTWVENLKTASGKDMTSSTHETWQKNKYRIHEYIAKYGKRKCEANSIVVAPELGREMLQDVIDKWLGKDAYENYEEHLEAGQERAKELIKERIGEN